MTYRLYNRLGSAGMAVEAVLYFAGIPFDLVEIDSAAGVPTPEDFRKINPWGQLPTLVLPNGDTLTESAAIMIYLAAAHPETSLGPATGSTEHARFMRWIIFTAVNVHEAVSRRTYPSRFTTSPSTYPEVISAANHRMSESLQLLDKEIAPGPFLLGDSMCAADIYFAMFFAWSRGAVELPHLEALTYRVRDHRLVAPVWKRHIDDRINWRG